jgi:hypothetical protein
MLKKLFNNSDFIYGTLKINESCTKTYPCFHNVIYITDKGIEIELGEVSGQEIHDAISMGIKCIYLNNVYNTNDHNKIALHFKYLRRFSKIYYESS